MEICQQHHVCKYSILHQTLLTVPESLDLQQPRRGCPRQMRVDIYQSMLELQPRQERLGMPEMVVYMSHEQSYAWNGVF